MPQANSDSRFELISPAATAAPQQAAASRFERIDAPAQAAPPQGYSNNPFNHELPFSPAVGGALNAVQKYVNEPIEAVARAGGEAGKFLFDASIGAGAKTIQRLDPGNPDNRGNDAVVAGNEAIGETIGQTIADPKSWPFFAGRLGSSIAQRGVDAGFGALAGHSAYTGGKQLVQDWDKLTPEQRVAQGVGVGTNAVFAGAGAHGALGSEAAAPRVQERTRSTTSPSASGPVTQAEPTEYLDKAVQQAQNDRVLTGKGDQGGVQPTVEAAQQMGGGAVGQKGATGVSGPDATTESRFEPVAEPTPQAAAAAEPRFEQIDKAPVQPEVMPDSGYSHPETGVRVNMDENRLDAGANSLFGKEYNQLSTDEQQRVVQSETPTTTGQSRFEPVEQRQPYLTADARAEEAAKQESWQQRATKKTQGYLSDKEQVAADQALLDNAEKPKDTVQAVAAERPAAAEQPAKTELAGDKVKMRGGFRRRSMLSDKPLFEDRPAPSEAAKAPEKPSDERSLASTEPNIAAAEKRVRELPGANSDTLNSLKSATQKLFRDDPKGFETRWRELLGRYEGKLREQNPSIGSLLKGEEGALVPAAVGAKAKEAMDWVHDQSERTKQARELADGLDTLGRNNAADVEMAKKLLDAIPGGKTDHEAVYHHLEGDQTPLTPRQQHIHDNYIKPLIAENKRMWEKIKGAELPVANAPDEPGYVPRIALNKGAKLENILLGRRRLSAGHALSKFSNSLKTRRYHAVTLGAQRMVAYEKGGEIQMWQNGSKVGKPMDKAQLMELVNQRGSGVRYGNATTKEIETHTQTKYLKHALGTTLINHLDLRRAERAIDWLEAYKSHPDFEKVAVKLGTATPPKGWKESDVPQFKGYQFEPHVREQLDKYWKEVKAGDPNAYDMMNKFLRTSIFFNPLIHIPNIANHWAVSKGAAGWLPNQWKGRVTTTLKAINSVMKHDEHYVHALREGVELQGAKRTQQEATALLVTKMTKDIAGNPKLAGRLADALGYANPIKLLRAVYDFSGKATWVVDDIARMQSVFEESAKTKKTYGEANLDIRKHLPNYRTPTRIANSETLGKFMNSELTMFGAYHYGALASYGHMMKELVSTGSKPMERAKAIDRAAMIGLMAFVVYPALDKLAQSATGDPGAKVRRAGANTFFANVNDVLHEKKSWLSGFESVVTPSPGPKLALDLAPKLSRPMPGQKAAKVVGEAVGKQIGPVGSAISSGAAGKDALSDPKTALKNFNWQRFLQSMIGVQRSRPGKAGGGFNMNMGKF